MKKLLFLLFFLPCIAFGQTTLIPDANFEQALIDLGYDNVLDGSVITANISSVDTLQAYSKNISDLTGIEDFTALTGLWCHSNQLTSLDVSNNTALTFLGCSYNQLTSLDVSGFTALDWLFCSNNQLTSLDVGNNTALTHLWCDNNQLTSLDVSNNTALTDLLCFSNQLTSLDVSNNTALTLLGCGYNQLTSLDVSNNTALEYLSCFNNQLTSLDVSNNTALEDLRCYSNQLTQLDVSNNTALITLGCEWNQLTDLDVSNSTALTCLWCFSNQLTCLNVKNGNNSNSTCFGVTGNPNLTCIEVDDAAWSTANWTDIDSIASFSDGCNNSCSSCLTTYGDDTQTGCNTYTWIDGNTYNSSNNTATHTLTNMAGCDSIVTLNLTINNSTTSTDTNTACDNYTWIDSNTYTTSNSTATHTLTNAAGCDSVVTLNLTINTVDNGINNNSPTLTAAAAGATYQWLDCDNAYTLIAGETNQSFTAISSGYYAVEVTQNNCKDTSDCESVTVVGLQENKVSNIHIRPNPTNDQITINIKGYQGPVEVEVYDLSGRLLQTTKFTTLSIKNYAKGIYVFKVSYGDRVEEIKVVKD